MGFIYQITNDINDKIYVGKTILSIQQRFKQHIKDSQKEDIKNRPLYKAINKYGKEHFFISLLGEYPDEDLNKWECYWIQKLNTYQTGYNATIGGDGKLLFDHEIIAEALKINPRPIEIARIFNCSRDTVYIIAKNYNIPIINTANEKFQQKKKQISQYSKDGKYIQSFESVTAAGEWCFQNNKCSTLNSGVRSHIAECANGKRKSAYGFYWKYE